MKSFSKLYKFIKFYEFANIQYIIEICSFVYKKINPYLLLTR